jgi:hypothetical protein
MNAMEFHAGMDWTNRPAPYGWRKVGNTGRVAEAWEAYNRANADILLV